MELIPMAIVLSSSHFLFSKSKPHGYYILVWCQEEDSILNLPIYSKGKKKLILPLKKRRKACEVKNLPTKKKKKRKGNEKYGSLQNYKYIMDIWNHTDIKHK